ncbi:hypothetical protein BU26DRAFT_419077 [Trematosphaeria pertusa]|uniref:Uncharacterized protein n=1 Tax=Trematosphaeria pertusa TaxID=390896 RepID=A0A6A6IRG0_9PLEO|nr:uncharacterized protein BU26DRAFT_419077 [Trematosphaeria pertusa]KAF2252757.1 hypothetical protein BU26DRAFT_419077 [Trematosphaeria pertusa]
MEVGVAGLDELEAPPPDENPYESATRRHRSLEDARRLSRGLSAHRVAERSTREERKQRLLAQLYTQSWLIFFSLFGTLARLGVEWATRYPNAPVTTNVLWANVGGSFILGYLQEDRALFAERRGSALFSPPSSSNSSGSGAEKGSRKLHAEHLAKKKTLPLYIGLTVGFCGSFTSFSSFMRDLLLALSNDLPSPAQSSSPEARSAGWSVSAVLGVAIIEVAGSLSALQAGAHLAIAVLPLLSKLPKINSARYMNPLGVVLGAGCWLGAVLLAIWPPQSSWRGEVLFALVFAPLGTMMRYILAITLNGIVAYFPLGTFAANIFGTMVLGIAYDLQHAQLHPADSVGGGIVGCQVLSGILEGFCGCLTTVSTWVVELKSLRKHHAYGYGIVSGMVGFFCLIIIVGSLRWTLGLSTPICSM